MVYTRSQKEKIKRCKLDSEFFEEYPQKTENIPEKTQCIKAQFKETLFSTNWKDSDFLNRVKKTYIEKLVTFSDVQEFSIEEWINFIINAVETNQETADIIQLGILDTSRQGICHLCQNIEVLSRNINFLGNHFVASKNCSFKLYYAVSFFVELEKLVKVANMHVENSFNDIFTFLENVIKETCKE